MDKMDRAHGASAPTGAGMREERAGMDGVAFTPGSSGSGGMAPEPGNERLFFKGSGPHGKPMNPLKKGMS